MTSETGTVKVPGGTLHYTIEGSGRLVLVIGSAVYYPRTFSQRLRESCRIAFMDLRHFAESNGTLGPASTSIETYLQDIQAVCDAAGFEQFVLVGHSHHGNIALEFAKHFTSRVSHLVLIGAPPCDVGRTIEGGRQYWDEHASEGRKMILRRNREALVSDRIASMGPREAFIAQYVADGPMYWSDANFDASHLWQDVPVNIDLMAEFRKFFADYEFSWDPAKLKSPVLAIIGRYDYAVPPILWEGVMPNVRNLTCRLLEQSGHTPQLEEPDLFDEILLEWLRREPAL